MFDNQIFAALGAAIMSNRDLAGLMTSVTSVLQSNQPVQVGVNSAPTVYVTKIMDRHVGSPSQVSAWQRIPPELIPALTDQNGNFITTENGVLIEPDPSIQPINITTESGVQITTEDGAAITTEVPPSGFTMVYTQTQVIESTFQIMALVPQTAEDTKGYTASDVLSLVRQTLISERVRTQLRAKGLGMYKPGDLRNPYFINDRGQNEAFPSFDLVLTHKQVIVDVAPIITSVEYRISRI